MTDFIVQNADSILLIALTVVSMFAPGVAMQAIAVLKAVRQLKETQSSVASQQFATETLNAAIGRFVQANTRNIVGPVAEETVAQIASEGVDYVFSTLPDTVAVLGAKRDSLKKRLTADIMRVTADRPFDDVAPD